MAIGVQRFLSMTAGTGLLILGTAGGQAKAATLPLTTPGNTTGGPTWNRPIEGTPPDTLDPNATAVPYSSQPFFVDTPGSYNFLSVATGGWDNYTFLYQNSFNPSQPLANVLIGNDDFPSTGQSGFSGVSLTANTQYYFVTTGATNAASGAFSNTISGGPATANITLGPVSGPGPTPVPFEFSPGLGLSILGAWFGLSHLKTKMGKHKTIPGSQDQPVADAEVN